MRNPVFLLRRDGQRSVAVAPKAKRFQARFPIVDSEGRPTPEFLRDLNSAIDIVNAIAAVQAAALAAQNAADAAQGAAESAQTAAEAAQGAADGAQGTGDAAAQETSLQGSYPANYSPPLVSADNLGNVTIASHDRVYGNPTLNPTVGVSGDIIATGYVTGDVARIYYDDPTRAGGAVSYQFTLNPTIAAQRGNRHSVGAVVIPAAGTVDGFELQPPGYVLIP